MSPSVATAVPASSRVTAFTHGIQITLRANQALWLRRYIASYVQALNDASLAAIGGEFMVQVAPFSLTSAPIVYPILQPLPIPLAGTTTGQLLTNVGLNFALLDDWIEFDDVPIGDPSGLSFLPGPFQLQTALHVINNVAVAKSVSAQEAATWEIWEARA